MYYNMIVATENERRFFPVKMLHTNVAKILFNWL